MIQAARAALPAEHQPKVIHEDKAYDSHANRLYCRLNGLRCAIAKRIQAETALGRKRWVIERTFAWLKRYRKLALRYERRADMLLALLLPGCACIAGKIRR